MKPKIEIVEKWRYKSGTWRKKYYKTCKISDILYFLESEDFKQWLIKNGYKDSTVNSLFTKEKTAEIFVKGFKAESENNEYANSMSFKNFKKEFGRQIEWIQDVKCFKCGNWYKGVKRKYSLCDECLEELEN